MKKLNEHTIVAGVAIIGIALLFVMTATSGKYFGQNNMDQYIITITEGENQSYLDSDTPTAMIISKIASSPFLRRDCKERGTCYNPETCTVVDNGYVMNNGHLVAKASVVKCTEEEETVERNTPSSQSYTTQDENY